MSTNYINQRNFPDLAVYTETLKEDVLYNRLNCVRIGKVVEFNPTDCTVQVQIAQQYIKSFDNNGIPISEDFEPIRAKVFFMGNANMGFTYPLNIGDEGLILFNDRELESWYLTGESVPPQYIRSHHITDAIFLCGMHSLVNLPSYSAGCLNLYYNGTRLEISDSGVNVTGNLNVSGSITATGDIVAGGISLMNHVHGNGNEGQDTTAPKG
jgi:hypothetical protein